MRAPSPLGARAQAELFTEAQDLVDAAERHVAALEGADLRRPADAEHLQGLFRAVHMLKGISGLFGLGDLASFSHAFEDLLDALRFERVVLDTDVHARPRRRHRGARRPGRRHALGRARG